MRGGLLPHIMIIPPALSLPLLRGAVACRTPTILQYDWFCTRISNFSHLPFCWPLGEPFLFPTRPGQLLGSYLINRPPPPLGPVTKLSIGHPRKKERKNTFVTGYCPSGAQGGHPGKELCSMDRVVPAHRNHGLDPVSESHFLS